MCSLSSFGRMIDLLLFFDGLFMAENRQIGWPPGGNFHFKPEVSSRSSWYLLNRDMIWCIRLASSCKAWLFPPNNWQSASTSLANSYAKKKNTVYHILFFETHNILYINSTSRNDMETTSSNTGCRMVTTHLYTNCTTFLLQFIVYSRSWAGFSIW